MQKIKVDLSDKKIARSSMNKTAITGVYIMNAVIALAYLLEVVKGVRSIPAYAVVALLCILPCIASFLVYKKNSDALAVRYICGVGFALLYTYLMMISDSNLVFCYVLVVLMIFVVYVDTKFLAALGGYAILVNVAVVIKKIIAGTFTAAELTDSEIIFACLILCFVFIVLAINKTAKINEANIDKADKEKKQSDRLLQKTLDVAASMTGNIKTAVDETDVLKTAIETNKSSMEELTASTEEAVAAISMQIESTEKINQYIQRVENVVESVTHEVDNAESNINESNVVMKDLLKQVQISEEAGSQAAQKMNELKEYTDRMQEILMLIRNVAEQTSLLALNASIEAARAGEAGRGFAVVASEIATLSTQSNNATEDINKIIEDIVASVESATGSMGLLLESSEKQSRYVDDTAGNFNKIRRNTRGIVEQVSQLKETVDVVTTENALVVEQTNNLDDVVNGVMEEATATLETANVNLENIANVVSVMDKLTEDADKLAQ